MVHASCQKLPNAKSTEIMVSYSIKAIESPFASMKIIAEKYEKYFAIFKPGKHLKIYSLILHHKNIQQVK